MVCMHPQNQGLPDGALTDDARRRVARSASRLLQDHDALYDQGVSAIYGPGTRIPAAALDMLDMLMDTDSSGSGSASGSNGEGRPS